MIESLFFWIFISLCSIYIALHIFLWQGLKRLFSPLPQHHHQSFSIIVAARNEEITIGQLIQSLVDQEYPVDKFEIIIVNDRSTDSTVSIIEKFTRLHSNVHLINIQSNNSDMPHKKNALQSGIGQATFDILAFTDADCIVPKHWLVEISKFYSDNVGVVAGYSPYTIHETNSFLRYEEYKNSLIAASAIELKNAFMCTGRNFSYRKSLFFEVGGFEEIKKSVSGDDDLFLQLVQRKTRWNIRYSISPECYVRTIPPTSFSQFVNQRTRHVSASTYYPTKIKLAYACVHLFHLSVFLGFFISPFISLIGLLLKFNIDALLIAKGKDVFHEEFSISEFVFDETLMVFYSFFIAPLGLVRTFDWKGTPDQ